MANKIILKKSSVASKVPLATDLEIGELAINLADAKLYSKDASGTVIAVGGSGGGSGDVVGPASATDNALARFDSTTGKLIQNSVVTVSDTGAIAGAESISNIDFAQFDTTVTPVEAVGKLQWDDGNGTLQVGLKGGAVNLQIGQEIVARVYNDSGVALTDGQVVYISGSQGNRIAVKLAKADSEATSAGTLGIVTEPIAIGAEGFITMTGTVNGLNTSALTAGALIYLSASTAGAYTTTAPTAPNHRVTLGYVERVHTTVGSVYVKVDNGYELDELHNVSIVTAASGNTLIYDAVAGVWENASISAGTGISVTNGAGSITIANTGVTSVSGTAPISSSGGATPAISISQATTSTNGYLSSTDWNTFNGKQAALVSGTNIKTVNSTSLLGSGNLAVGTVTSVSGTAPISVATGTSTPAISISQASSTTNGYLSSTDWNTFNNKGSGNGTVTSVTGGSYLTGGTITTSGTLAVDATSANTASKVVARDASGNFSAGTITATLNGNASTATTATNAGNADTLDGQHGSYYQPASTAITTSNIGSQSVNYATSAGSASSATNATNATNATYTSYPAFSGDSVSKDNITTRTDSGFYESSTGTTAEGWPVNDGGWQHMIATTHSNDANYFSMQIGGSFFDNVFYGRKTNGSGTTGWVQFITSGNIGSQSVNYATSAGSATTSSNSSALEGYTWTASGKNVRGTEIYADNWFRNYNSLEGLYNEANGTHWYSHGGGGFTVTGNGSGSTAEIRFCSTHQTNTRGYVYADTSNNIGFLNNAGNWSWKMDSSGNGTATGNVTAYSDETLKKNWRPVQEGFVEKLAKVKSGIYDRTDIKATQAGVSAQDMEKLLAETVQKDDKGILSLAYGNAALVAAIELAKQVVELKKEIELLKAK